MRVMEGRSRCPLFRTPDKFQRYVLSIVTTEHRRPPLVLGCPMTSYVALEISH